MRDVTKILSDAEILKFRELLRNVPVPAHPLVFGDYPRQMYRPDWYPLYLIVKESADLVQIKMAREALRTHEQTVIDITEEEEFLLDGWVSDPNDLAIKYYGRDPRVPTGREGRQAEKARTQARADELLRIRRRYAELTGRRLRDEPFDAVSTSAPAEEPSGDEDVDVPLLEEPLLETTGPGKRSHHKRTVRDDAA
jgi:hypothetical protein